MKTEINLQEEAQKILDDILEERGEEFEGDVYGMGKDDALETVKAYGHKGKIAKEIAGYLWSLAEGI